LFRRGIEMKKGQTLTGIVERVDFPNKGIVTTQEGSCTVKNVLPGQKVTFVVQKKRNGRAEGRLLQVEEASPVEVPSPCPHFGECGGCLYLSLPYEQQLQIKERQVKKLLDSVLSGQAREWEFEGILESPRQLGYRNKMEFSFGDEYKGGPLSLGMHKRGSFYDIVTTQSCQIVDEDYRRILAFTRAYFEGSSFFHRLTHIGYLRHLLVRKAARTGEILIALVTTSQQEAGSLKGWKEGLLQLGLQGKIAGILHIVNDSVADVVQSDLTQILYGKDYFYEELLGLRFKISVFSFFQTNSLGAEVLYEKVREYIGDLGGSREEEGTESWKGKVVFDLFSGTGTIAQLMAPAAGKVIGVEIVEEAVEAARRNAELNGLTNCEFIAGDVLRILDGIEERPDLIILDPPRDGVHPKALGKIIDYGVERMVYVSCKPTSLVRDLEVFLERGYVVEKAVAVDMFPWTSGVETVVSLSRIK
jgi:23S rRNA (uracil-5-)-methyltransferase RumA